MELTAHLKHLADNIDTLEEIRCDITVEDMVRSKRLEWEVRYGIFESIQLVIDIACKITAHYNLGNPKNYRECIELLEKGGYLSQKTQQRCVAMVGLRNLLVHEYGAINKEKLYAFLDHIDDFRQFVHEISCSIQ